MSSYLLRRLMSRQKLHKVAVERLTEPLHLNAVAAGVAMFGTYRSRVAFDLVVRPQYAWPILHAADAALETGHDHIVIIEFGVASGAGLLNMARLAERTTAATGVKIDVVGFDTGAGMPPAVDYRDHPEAFQSGDFPMDFDALSKALPKHARLVIGPIAETVPVFLQAMSPSRPLGFVAIDVDYYSSAVDCLKVFEGPADCYLPWLPLYLDDITLNTSSPFAGENLAVSEFNASHPMRKIAPFPMLRSRRVFKNPIWIEQMFAAQIHDHPSRSPAARRAAKRVIANEYLG